MRRRRRLGAVCKRLRDRLLVWLRLCGSRLSSCQLDWLQCGVLSLGQLGLWLGHRLLGLTAPRPRHKTEVRPARLLLLAGGERRGECLLALVLVKIDSAPPIVEIYLMFLLEFMPLVRGVDSQRPVERNE